MLKIKKFIYWKIRVPLLGKSKIHLNIENQMDEFLKNNPDIVEHLKQFKKN
jgi:hypothetical protein